MLEFSLEPRLPGNRIIVDLNSDDGLLPCEQAMLSRLRLLKHSSRAHREVRPTDPKNINNSLRTLAVFSKFMAESGIEWYFTGGIAIDLVKRASFRRHGDLDIVLPISEAQRLQHFLRDSGVAAYRKVGSARYRRDDSFTLFHRAVPSVRDFGKHRTLKLFLRPGGRLLPVVDIHFVAPAGRELSLLCEREVISLPFPLAGDRVFFVEGLPIRCCDLRLILFLKSDDNPRNFRDAQRVAAELPDDEVLRVLQLRRRRVPAREHGISLVPEGWNHRGDRRQHSSHKASTG